MRVLYFHQHFSTPRGKTGVRSYVLAQQLLAAGHQVTMVCGSFGVGSTDLTSEFVNLQRRGVVDGIDVIELNLSYLNSHGFLKRSITFIKYALFSVYIALTESYDIVFSTSTPLTAGIPGIAARWLRRKPFVFEVRDLWPELPREMGVIRNPIVLGLMSFLEWISYHSATRCIGLSPGIARGIVKRGVPDEKVIVVPNGCDFRLLETLSTKSKRPPAIHPTELMAVYCGTHGQANGLDALLDVAEELQKRKRHDIKILLIGDGATKQNLIQAAQAKNLSNIIFHDSVLKAEMFEILKLSDVGLQCLMNVPAFYYGTSPNKFFDYLSCGLPVINNYPGWLADLIEEYQCGFVVKPNDAEHFADALEMAADDRHRLAVMGQNSTRLGEKYFDRETLAKTWVDWVTAR